MVIEHNEVGAIIAALDKLAVALADHGHQWTNEERRAYEKAMRILT